MVPQGDVSFPKQVALLFPAAVFHADASTNRSILSSDSLIVGYWNFGCLIFSFFSEFFGDSV